MLKETINIYEDSIGLNCGDTLRIKLVDGNESYMDVVTNNGRLSLKVTKNDLFLIAGMIAGLSNLMESKVPTFTPSGVIEYLKREEPSDAYDDYALGSINELSFDM